MGEFFLKYAADVNVGGTVGFVSSEVCLLDTAFVVLSIGPPQHDPHHNIAAISFYLTLRRLGHQ